MDECVFCQIVAGKSPASVFYPDDVVLGLVTIGPVTTGHALIIPKQHAAYLSEMDEETGRHLWTVTQCTAAAIRRSGVRCEGINLISGGWGSGLSRDLPRPHACISSLHKGPLQARC